jgi:hypothetical protein
MSETDTENNFGVGAAEKSMGWDGRRLGSGRDDDGAGQKPVDDIPQDSDFW